MLYTDKNLDYILIFINLMIILNLYCLSTSTFTGGHQTHDFIDVN